MKKLLIGIIVLALVAGCSSASGTATPAPTPATKKTQASGASAQGYVTPVRKADLAFRASGRVTQVLVKEGEQVKIGQPLVKLQDADLKAALAQAQADLAQLQAGARPEEIAEAQANLNAAVSQAALAATDLSRLQNGLQAVDLAAAQAQLARAEADLKVAQDSYDFLTTGRGIPADSISAARVLGYQEELRRAQLAVLRAARDAAQQRLTQVQTGASSELHAAQARVGAALAQRDSAQAQLDLLKAGAAVEQIDAAKARVAQAQAALDEATLLAPFDGTIAELTVDPGEVIAPGTLLISLADLTQWQVETDDLSEVDVVAVQPEAEVKITVDALPGVTLKGKVISITPRSVVKRGDVTYTVKVAITDPDPRLKWGMTAFVDVRSK
jgi:HlyD family secretion protein